MLKFIKSKLLVPLYLNLDSTLGIYFFNNLNAFSLNIYNYFYKKIIFKKKNLNLINSFINQSYQKIGKANIDYIEQMNEEIKKQNPKKNDNSRFRFEINQNMINIVKKIISENCSDHIKELEKCYASTIKLSWIGIVRNYEHSSETEQFSNFFHTDGYNLSLIKMFINLQDIDENHGALQIVKKNYSKKFIKSFKMKNKNGKINSLRWLFSSILNQSYKIYKFRRVFLNQSVRVPKEMIYENLGKKGDILIADTTDVIHRAGTPNKDHHRDLISLEFIALPYDSNTDRDYFSLEKNYKNIFSDIDNWFSKKIAKPYGLKQLIKQFFIYKKNSSLIK
tara:strand:- start:509 stop:1516 length:1008 start_codon:yes stop_codon:yes gene_type:complete